MSGYTDDAVVRHGVLGSDVPYLQKPLTPKLVGRRVREVLDTPSERERNGQPHVDAAE
jgi:two-component system cell cycle sensor histidine kinase/response regulator CckA